MDPSQSQLALQDETLSTLTGRARELMQTCDLTQRAHQFSEINKLIDTLVREVEIREILEEVVEKLISYSNNNELYSYCGLTRQQNDVEQAEIRKKMRQAKKDRDDFSTATKAINDAGISKSTLLTVLNHIDSRRARKDLRNLINRTNGNIEEVARLINVAMIDRLKNPRRGVTAARYIHSTDIGNAIMFVKEGTNKIGEIVSHDDMNEFGLVLYNGFLASKEAEYLPVISGIESGEQHEAADSTDIEMQESSGTVPTTEQIRNTRREQDVLEIAYPGHPHSGDNRQAMNFNEHLVNWISNVDAEEPFLSTRDEEAFQANRILREGGCKCEAAVSEPLKAALSSRQRFDSRVALRYLTIYGTHEIEKSLSVCYAHTQKMASKLHLVTKGLNHDNLRQRLLFINRYRNDIGFITTNEETYTWFRREGRPARQSDNLGPYRYFSVKLNFKYLTVQEQQNLLKALGLSQERYEKWGEDGSVIIPDVFSWWKRDTELNLILKEEYEMYLWHQREIGGRSNYGWLRTMVHSLFQQAMRQDLFYYLLYIGLRPDGATSLISYPYYAKYAIPGDNTAFRHIDINIRKMLESGRGKNQIQGSISIDDEGPDDCTEILPRMHKYIGAWWEDLKGRKLDKDGHVQKITDAMFSRADSERYGTDWTPQPCSAFGVRISRPDLPHGAIGPCKRYRRTMLPWFVAVQADGNTLEISDGGTWEELSKCHRDLTAAHLTPSGFANHYGAIPFAFAAAVHLSPNNPVSAALVGQRRFSHPEVRAYLDALLKGSEGSASGGLLWNYINEQRRKTAVEIKRQWKMVIFAEKNSFGEKSFFNCKERGFDRPPPDEIEVSTDIIEQINLSVNLETPTIT